MYGYLYLISSVLFLEIFKSHHARASSVIPSLLLKTIPLGDYTTLFIQVVHSIGLCPLLTSMDMFHSSASFCLHMVLVLLGMEFVGDLLMAGQVLQWPLG